MVFEELKSHTCFFDCNSDGQCSQNIAICLSMEYWGKHCKSAKLPWHHNIKLKFGLLSFFCIFAFLSFHRLIFFCRLFFPFCLFVLFSFWFFLSFCVDITLIKCLKSQSHSLCLNSKVALSHWRPRVGERAARAAQKFLIYRCSWIRRFYSLCQAWQDQHSALCSQKSTWILRCDHHWVVHCLERVRRKGLCNQDFGLACQL